MGFAVPPSTDTIAAIATAPGRGGVGVIRISGPLAVSVAEAVVGDCPPPRHAAYRRFVDAHREAIDSGLVLYFPGPASYTGEDVLELQGHGGPVVLDAVLARVLDLGCRAAEAGEFTRRAFENQRLDLSQAEAVADLIDADSLAAARAAQRSLSGAFSRRIDAFRDELLSLRTWVEASIDFADEDIDFLADGEVARRLSILLQHLQELRRQTDRGRVLAEGLRVAIVGAPNVGKSSLLNALAGHDAAIVTEIAGTTRDVLRERVVLDGLSVLLLDTAGIRVTDDPIEQIGVQRAWATLDDADVVLVMSGDGQPSAIETDSAFERLRGDPRLLRLHNKCDLTAGVVGLRDDGSIGLSVLQGQGLDALIKALQQRAGLEGGAVGEFSARRRHLDAIDRALQGLEQAEIQLKVHQAPELLAEDLALANRVLGEINGPVDTETLLGSIFSSFCVGK
ncbi:tRNA uridine-5-carboxymethylaminomethyl(34) synthesis GTPase MnmE [Abyssibacter profundi]|uniref:tRNA modification GTPase MnmE n=1 Tax=Abyssibacter profundi TaxID=2182787 RepID=A0A383XR56_9GAMM|nr:tRNA uridine-5-carboxymethylaminomethyl(34) synthesis GTPase MnmE [Abyssibacter profundi]PWN55110.1 tRNA uridine-5-carboxymethylaminomethyl(34) synthesis GTPase MnmE [Abyssibacter profundi]